MEHVRDQESESRTERRPRPEPAPPAPELLGLPRGAGNAAVSRWVESRKLARYGTGEHAQMSKGARTVQMHGQTVTEGELLTMGDFYATPDDMKNDAKGFPNLLALVRRDKQFREGVPGATKVSDNEWEGATKHMGKGKGYADLAMDNDTHFAPAASGHRNNRNEWWKHYSRAITLTQDHVRGGGSGVPPEALMLCGFAGHFLTDAFSAGHILGKQDIKDFARERAEDLGADETFFDWPFPESSFSDYVAGKLLGDSRSGPKLKKYKIRIVEWDDITRTKLSELIYAMQDREPELYYGLFALIVHDVLNRSIKPGSTFGPLEVTNNHGKTWNLSGDGTLALSPETQQVAQEAVEESYRLLQGVTLDPDSVELPWVARRIWDYTPQPSAKGAQTLKAVLQTYADPARQETKDAVVDTLIDQIDLIIAKLRERRRLATPEEVAEEFRRNAALVII